MKSHFFFNPRVYGFFAGALLLGLLQSGVVYIAVLIWTPHFRMDRDLFMVLVIRCISGLFWGGVLGSQIGRAVQELRADKRDTARHTLWEAGLVCSLLQGGVIALIVGGLAANESPISRWLWDCLLTLGAYILTNFCLQASLLTFLAAKFFPRLPEEGVQVTEKLRL